MWSIWRKYLERRQWTNRKIAFVSVLIATSVAFVIVFTSIVAIAAIPSFKFMAGGLPVKLTGYIFGPFIGGLTGIISDLLSFAMRPVYYHWTYTIAWMLGGVIPGIFGYFMNKQARNNPKKHETEYNKKNFIITMLTLLIVMATMLAIFLSLPESSFAKSLIHSKTVFIIISQLGMISMFIGLIIFRFVMKPRMFNDILPIIAFSAVLEVCISPLLTLGDQSTFFTGTNTFILNYTAHTLFAPVKIWGNMLVILFAYRVVSPLIYNKSNNSY